MEDPIVITDTEDYEVFEGDEYDTMDECIDEEDYDGDSEYDSVKEDNDSDSDDNLNGYHSDDNFTVPHGTWEDREGEDTEEEPEFDSEFSSDSDSESTSG